MNSKAAKNKSPLSAMPAKTKVGISIPDLAGDSFVIKKAEAALKRIGRTGFPKELMNAK